MVLHTPRGHPVALLQCLGYRVPSTSSTYPTCISHIAWVFRGVHGRRTLLRGVSGAAAPCGGYRESSPACLHALAHGRLHQGLQWHCTQWGRIAHLSARSPGPPRHCMRWRGPSRVGRHLRSLMGVPRSDGARSGTPAIPMVSARAMFLNAFPTCSTPFRGNHRRAAARLANGRILVNSQKANLYPPPGCLVESDIWQKPL